ncbi:endolytic transglycosylase MltG [Effusibacillus dendaii]|uniref:Endolytic murein transglycosylase n=1 Tax=Effusibacillus dendaii TaxID=2743772 RepID=A0A7I8DAA1_9BACL|nr:endolytic transglycosylase MltG [Effusibacillus dendaii]BCJ86292.1 aminodeoxychorismate lyase [Effusibacillus dendaii]
MGFTPPQRARQIRRSALFLILLILLFVWYLWTPPASDGRVVSVEIKQGSTTAEIANLLEQKGLVKSSFLFRLAVLLNGQAASLQAGTYEISRGSSMTEIADIIGKGKTRSDIVKFTIPEGYTVEQIADVLSKNGLVDRQRFLQEADNGTFSQEFLKSEPQNTGIRHRLEGYLYPDTYEIKKGTAEHDILNMMLNQFDQVVDEQMRQQFQANGLSLHQAVTLASLVEREARVAKERPIIAGVIYNRLRHNPPMLLQIDAAVQYAVGQKAELTYQDLQVNSPYNTYKREGLPPGPIACPGKDSLLAVAEPDHNEFLYYVTKKDGSGEHYFGKTLEEHNHNIALSEQNQARHQ